MKTILLSIFALTLALPMSASAATFSFTPSTGTFVPEQTFYITVFVNPSAGEEITTAKLSATFSSSVVEVVSFAQEAGWMTLAQPGYDALDNTTGKLIKTGGYPAKVTTSKKFGVITLKAKADGVAALTVAGDSLLLDATNADKHTGSAGASFTVETPAPAPPAAEEPNVTQAPAPTPDPVVVAESAPTTAEEPTAEEQEATTTEDVATTSTSTEGQLAAAAAIDTGLFGMNKTVWYVILVILILLLVGYLIWRKRMGGTSI